MNNDYIRALLLGLFAVVGMLALGALFFLWFHPTPPVYGAPLMVGLFIVAIISFILVFILLRRSFGPNKLVAAGVGFIALMPSLTSKWLPALLVSVASRFLPADHAHKLEGWASAVSGTELSELDYVVLFSGLFMIAAGIYWSISLNRTPPPADAIVVDINMNEDFTTRVIISEAATPEQIKAAKSLLDPESRRKPGE